MTEKFYLECDICEMYNDLHWCSKLRKFIKGRNQKIYASMNCKNRETMNNKIPNEKTINFIDDEKPLEENCV